MHPSLLQSLILALAGFSAGFVDSIAGGGGIISLPALLAVGMPPHLALGTNKLQASLGTAFAAGNYGRRGLIDRSQLPLGMTCTAIGALAGAMLVVRLPSMWLARAVPWLLVAIFVYVVRSPRLGESAARARLAVGTFSVVFGLVLGFYDGFFGPGTGSFWTMAFLAVGGLPLAQATAHTKVMNLTSNAVALVWFAVHGDVLWRVGLGVAAANVAGALAGSSLAMEKGARLIRMFFLAAVAATLARLVWQSGLWQTVVE
jgi:uncharacterized membrane protein YfcA